MNRKSKLFVASIALAVLMASVPAVVVPLDTDQGLVELFGSDVGYGVVHAHECSDDGGGGDQGNREECKRGKSGGGKSGG